MADEFRAVAEREGDPDLIDKIADERNVNTVDQLMAWLEEHNHPAMIMAADLSNDPGCSGLYVFKDDRVWAVRQPGLCPPGFAMAMTIGVPTNPAGRRRSTAACWPRNGPQPAGQIRRDLMNRSACHDLRPPWTPPSADIARLLSGRRTWKKWSCSTGNEARRGWASWGARARTGRKRVRRGRNRPIIDTPKPSCARALSAEPPDIAILTPMMAAQIMRDQGVRCLYDP